MTKDEINEFSKRIAQSNKTQLVVITYEIIVNYLDSAKASENERDFIHNLQKAQQFLNDLISSLDYSYELAYDLLSLYGFANRSITKSIARNEDCNLGTVRNMMVKLGESFEKISSEDKSGTVLKNVKPVYAGITYGKNSINEITPPGSTYN